MINKAKQDKTNSDFVHFHYQAVAFFISSCSMLAAICLQVILDLVTFTVKQTIHVTALKCLEFSQQHHTVTAGTLNRRPLNEAVEGSGYYIHE